MVVRALGLTLSSGILVSTCVVIPCARSVFIALLVWHCGLNYSLAVLGVFSPSPPLFAAFFFPTEPSGLSVMGACGGLGIGGLWLGCGLGRPVGCSSALGM